MNNKKNASATCSASNSAKIASITKFTTTDYPHHLSAIIWFSTCNMRCSYCYNEPIIDSKNDFEKGDILAFLHSRIDKLDAVVLSGGECTLYAKLVEFCTQIKKMGFKIKIDTNGSNTHIIKELLEANLIDFVALDFKAPKHKYQKITKTNLYDKWLNTLHVLTTHAKNSPSFDYEVRTTLHEDLLNENDINEMVDVLLSANYNKTFFIQHFLHVETIDSLDCPTRILDKSKLSDKLKIEFRNE